MGSRVVGPTVGPPIGSCVRLLQGGYSNAVGCVVGAMEDSVGRLSDVDMAGSTLDASDCNEGQWDGGESIVLSRDIDDRPSQKGMLENLFSRSTSGSLLKEAMYRRVNT